MDKQKQMELVRERNRSLEQTVQELRDKIEFDKQFNTESVKKAQALIEELEQIKQEWADNVIELEEKHIQFDRLVAETKRLRSLMEQEMERVGISKRRRKRLIRLAENTE